MHPTIDLVQSTRLTRRECLIMGTSAALSLSLALSGGLGCSSANKEGPPPPLRTNIPQRALVTWFSQTGHTERLGRLMAWQLKQAGLEVTGADSRELSSDQLANHDLIIVGCPVFYYDIPVSFKALLKQYPAIVGVGIGAYTTFGGPGHNQHNTACTMLDLLSARGGVPLGMSTFGNMSTFAPTWSMGMTKRILKYSHLPDGDTFNRAKDFASTILKRAQNGSPVEVVHQRGLARQFGRMNTVGITKKMLIGRHRFFSNKCIQCGLCMRKCPTNAISVSKQEVRQDACILCYGCVNVCPVQAFDMSFMRKPVKGFFEFLKENRVAIKEPPELEG